jgi:hypothetical protein
VNGSFFSAFVDVLVCGLMCVMVLIAALFVSLGFRVWCDEMTRRFETCSDAMGNPIDKVPVPAILHFALESVSDKF